MAEQERKVGVLLTIGIVLMPYIFGWFLLREGYSARARMWGLGYTALMIFIIFFGGNTTSKVDNQTQATTTNQAQPLTEKTATDSTPEKSLNVPSDSKAQFFVLEKGGAGAKRTIVTKRVGTSGTSYSKRLYNCKDNTVKYLGTGDSLAEMASSKADTNMSVIIKDSIAYYVGLAACSENTNTETPSSEPVINSQWQSSQAEPIVTNGQWQYSQNEDPMSNGTTSHAVLLSTNTVEFDFPYNGAQNAKLNLRVGRRYGKDVIFSIEKGQILCNSYEDCNVLVRFDDEKATNYSAVGAADNSTNTIFIQNYSRFVERMSKAKRVRISTNIYQEGAPVFEFNVSGFDQSQLKPKN